MKNATQDIKVGTKFSSINRRKENGVIVESEWLTTVVKITGSRIITETPSGHKQTESLNTITKSITNGFRKIVE